MNACFADSAYCIALLNPTDTYHRIAKELSEALKAKLVTTTWVLVETGGARQTARSRSAFVSLVDRLDRQAQATVVPPSEHSFKRGLEVFRQRLDKSWSMLDCISFLTMQELGITQALTSDKHFTQAGFEVMMTR